MDNLAALLRGADEDRLTQERLLEPRRARITELQLQEQAARLAEEQFTEQLNAREVDRERWPRSWPTSPTNGAAPAGCNRKSRASRARSSRWARSTWPRWTS